MSRLARWSTIIALVLPVLGGCSEGEQSSAVDIEVSKGSDCPADVDQYDVIVKVIAQQACAYAWHRGFGTGSFPLSDLDLPAGTEVSVQVAARKGEKDSCVRCAATSERFTLGTDSHISLVLGAVSDCGKKGVYAEPVQPCSACLPTSDAYCAGNVKVTCLSSEAEPRGDHCLLGCRLGECLSCPLKVYYPDKDGDTYGDAAQPQEACTQPAGYVVPGGDCNDNNGEVHPGQQQWFAQAHANGATQSFDYDCDGKETQELQAGAGCNGVAGGGAGCTANGWANVVTAFVMAAAPPACGATAGWYDCPPAGTANPCLLTGWPLTALPTKQQRCR